MFPFIILTYIFFMSPQIPGMDFCFLLLKMQLRFDLYIHFERVLRFLSHYCRCSSTKLEDENHQQCNLIFCFLSMISKELWNHHIKINIISIWFVLVVYTSWTTVWSFHKFYHVFGRSFEFKEFIFLVCVCVLWWYVKQT